MNKLFFFNVYYKFISCHHIPRWFCWLKPDSSDDDIKLAGILGWIFQFVRFLTINISLICYT